MKKTISIAILILLFSLTLSGCKSSQQTDDAVNVSQKAATEEPTFDEENRSTVETVRIDETLSDGANVSAPQTPSAKKTSSATIVNNPDAPISVEDVWYEIADDEDFKLFIFFRNTSSQKFTSIQVYYDIINSAGDIIYSDYNFFDNILDCEQACTIDDYVSRSETGDSLFGIRISKIEVRDLKEKYNTIYIDPSIIIENIRLGKFAEAAGNSNVAIASHEVSSVGIEFTETPPAECDHSWKEADCTAPKTCTKCGQTEGAPLDHTPGDWEQADPDYSMPFIFLHKKCTVCNKVLKTESYAINSFVNDGTFLFSPKEFSKRLTGISDVLKYSYDIKLGNPNGEVYGSRITKNGKAIAVVCYLTEWPDKGDSTMGVEQENDRNVSAMVASFQTKDESDVLKLLDAILISCDPTLGTQTETRNLISSIKKASAETGPYKYNNISYFIYKKDNGYYSFLIELTD